MKTIGRRSHPSWAGGRVEVVDPDPSGDSNPTPPSSREGFDLCPIPALEGGGFRPLSTQGKDGATPSYSSASSPCRMTGDRASQKGCTPLACSVGWSVWRAQPIPYAAGTNFLGVGSFQKFVDDSKLISDGLGRRQNERTRKNVIKYLLLTNCLIKCVKENGSSEQFVLEWMRSCNYCFLLLC